MSTNFKLRYKADTGESPYLSIESQSIIGELDPRIFEDYSKPEIIELLDYDLRYNSKWGIYVDQLPNEYNDGEDVSIYSPEYVRWLEDQLTVLERKTNKTE